MGVRERLAQAGLQIPVPPVPVGAYVPAVRSGALVFTSGQIPMRDGSLVATGRVGGDVSVDEGRRCAVQCVLNALAAASTVCDLDEVERVVKVVGYVSSDPGFTGQPGVIDAASDVILRLRTLMRGGTRARRLVWLRCRSGRPWRSRLCSRCDSSPCAGTRVRPPNRRRVEGPS